MDKPHEGKGETLMKSMKFQITRKKIVFAAIIFMMMIALVAGIAFNQFGTQTAHASSGHLQGSEEVAVRSTATLNDDFTDCTVLVVLSRAASRDLRDFTVEDFPEFDFYSVEDISPGLELARVQTMAAMSRRASHFYYDSNWSINLETFRRIKALRLREPSRENVLTAVRALEQRDDVISANPNFIEYLPTAEYDAPMTNPNAAHFGQQWNLPRVEVPNAWGFTTGQHGQNVIRVGVLDTGIQANHVDLTGRIYRRNPHDDNTTLHRDFSDINTGGANGVRVLEPVDARGHGTHVAGIISTSGIGIAGAANIMLVDLKVLPDVGGGNVLAQTRAIRYATNLPAAQRIHILNASLGGTNNNVDRRDAIDQFPGLFVAAAGNNGAGLTPGGWDNDENGIFPANHRLNNLISVGATHVNAAGNDIRSAFSNWASRNETVCIWAPGTDIPSTYPAARFDPDHPTQGWSHIAPGYRILSGTSMAAPLVAGVAALMQSVNMNLNGQQLRDALIANSVQITIAIRNPHGAGNVNINVPRLHANRAVAAAAFNTSNIGTADLSITGLRTVAAMPQSSTLVIPERFAPIGQNVQRNVTQIGANAFSGNTRVMNVHIPSTVAIFDANAFTNATNLRAIKYLQQTPPAAGNIFSGVDRSRVTVAIPQGESVNFNSAGWNGFNFLEVQEIVTGAHRTFSATGFIPTAGFDGYLRIPNGITGIANNAFQNIEAITALTIPSSVETLGNNFANGATNLRTIFNHRFTPQVLNANTFAGITRANISVVVPSGRQAAYTAAAWTNFILVEAPLMEFTRIGATSNARVSGRVGASHFTGRLEIPSYITQDGINLTVTEIAQNGFQGFLANKVILPNDMLASSKDEFQPETIIIVRALSVGLELKLNRTEVSSWEVLGLLSNSHSWLHIHVPRSFLGIPITNIAAHAFGSGTSINSIAFECSIEHIGENAFAGAINLRTITVISYQKSYRFSPNYNRPHYGLSSSVFINYVPIYFGRCYFNDYLHRYFDTIIRTWLINGNPDLGTPVMDPLLLDEKTISVDIGDGQELEIYFENIVIVGASRFEITSIKTNKNLSATINISLDTLMIVAEHYFILCGAPIWGEGEFQLGLSGIELAIKFQLREREDGFLEIRKFNDLSISIYSARANFEGIVSGGDLGIKMNRIISDKLPGIITSNSEVFLARWAEAATDLFNPILGTFTLTDFLIAIHHGLDISMAAPHGLGCNECLDCLDCPTSIDPLSNPFIGQVGQFGWFGLDALVLSNYICITENFRFFSACGAISFELTAFNQVVVWPLLDSITGRLYRHGSFDKEISFAIGMDGITLVTFERLNFVGQVYVVTE